jgi:predicted RNA binding protein YcfA (HicA-like mRNA interferase family)
MPIDFSKIRALTAAEITSALLADGFELRKSRRGTSHRRYFHADGRRVTVAFHGANTTFVPKTLKSMVEEQARWTEDDLVRLGLMRR